MKVESKVSLETNQLPSKTKTPIQNGICNSFNPLRNTSCMRSHQLVSKKFQRLNDKKYSKTLNFEYFRPFAYADSGIR